MKYLSFRLIAFLLISAISAFVALPGGSASSTAESQGKGPDNKFHRVKKRVPGQWAAGSVFKLGSQHAQDNMTWGLNRVVVTQPVPPGGQYTFNFFVTAPAPKGTYNFQWRMVKEGVEWFGAFTNNVAVIVKLPSCLRC